MHSYACTDVEEKYFATTSLLLIITTDVSSCSSNLTCCFCLIAAQHNAATSELTDQRISYAVLHDKELSRQGTRARDCKFSFILIIA